MAGLAAIPTTLSRMCFRAYSKFPSFDWICMSMSDGLSTLTGAANIGSAGSTSRSACICRSRACLSRSLRSILLSCSSCLGFCDFFISKSPPPLPADSSDEEDKDDSDEEDNNPDPAEAELSPANPNPPAAEAASELNECRFRLLLLLLLLFLWPLLFIAHLALHITMAESEPSRT